MLNICPAEEIDLTARSKAFYVDALPETGVDDLIYVTPEGDSLAMYVWVGEEYVKVSGECVGSFVIPAVIEVPDTETAGEYIERTYEEIREAYEAGQPMYVSCRTDADHQTRILYLSEVGRDSPKSFTFRGRYEEMTGQTVTSTKYIIIKVDEHDHLYVYHNLF